MDPDGRAVDSVTVDKNKNVHIVIGISFKGVTVKQAAELKNGIVNEWGGKKGPYAVTVTITPAEKARLGNTITIVEGSGQSGTKGVGGREATAYTNDHRGASLQQTVNHEVGHLMDHGDRNNQNTGEVNSGWEGNIMGDPTGKVDSRNIEKVIERYDMRNTRGAKMVRE